MLLLPALELSRVSHAGRFTRGSEPGVGKGQTSRSCWFCGSPVRVQTVSRGPETTSFNAGTAKHRNCSASGDVNFSPVLPPASVTSGSAKPVLGDRLALPPPVQRLLGGGQALGMALSGFSPFSDVPCRGLQQLFPAHAGLETALLLIPVGVSLHPALQRDLHVTGVCAAQTRHSGWSAGSKSREKLSE